MQKINRIFVLYKSVNEMTAIELERKKAQLLNEIDSEELYNKVKKYISRVKKQNATLPNQYKTIEELYAAIEQSEKDIKEGRTHTQEEVENLYKSWL